LSGVRRIWLLALALGAAAPAAADAPADPALALAVAGPQRSPAFLARDAARHPLQELLFFGLRPDAAVVEIWPGGGYWTEILAPYLRERGRYYLAVPPQAGSENAAALRRKLASDPALYDKITVTEFGRDHGDIAPAGTVDLILTFRNLHNWMADGYAEAALAAFARALKPGGVLGIEDHRARDDVPQDPAAANGYVRQDYAVMLAEQAGLRFVAASEISANPRDTKDWPKGVWTLPPTFALGEQDRATYAAIGEADNFVLKFQKPAD